MAYAYTHHRRVEFAETDMAGIVHFSNFFRFMEVTEAAFYRSLGFSVASKSGEVGWPRVHSSCDYLAPLRFEDEMEIQMIVAQKKTRSVEYAFRIYKIGSAGRTLCARGKIVVVSVRAKTGGGLEACAIPEYFNSKIEEAPPVAKAEWMENQSD